MQALLHRLQLLDLAHLPLERLQKTAQNQRHHQGCQRYHQPQYQGLLDLSAYCLILM